jgi:hypothetical protein
MIPPLGDALEFDAVGLLSGLLKSSNLNQSIGYAPEAIGTPWIHETLSRINTSLITR